ncbi:hypothetical protein [Cellulophaga baltica]|uniref:hypothetical protein n=1 Tax=Cellulophaga baltica TaxID=76594 RepID=UPI000471133B|nr:hypothetical protein [Cellulophaga baltica]AIY14021.1 hypothetical protein M667_12870 [Cellulophaga baltica NN016038]
MEIRKFIQKEVEPMFNGNEYGKYLAHFITDFRSSKQWKEEIIPFLEGLISKSVKINDWSDNEWGGSICFRNDYVYFVDEAVYKVGNKVMGLFNEDGSQMLNEYYIWLDDTNYIEKNYTQYFKIKTEELKNIGSKWIEYLDKEKK